MSPIPLKFDCLDMIIEEPKFSKKLKKLTEKTTSLMVKAASENQLHIVSELLKKHSVGVDVAHCSKDGMTALQGACRNGHIDMIDLFLDRNANLEQEDDKGRRAIHYAVKG